MENCDIIELFITESALFPLSALHINILQ